MSLEPTEEQRRSLFAALNHLGMSEWRGKTIEALWPLIRDMVAEEAARVAFKWSPPAGHGYPDPAWLGPIIAEAIRSLKGTP